MNDYDLSQTDLDRERNGWHYEAPETMTTKERSEQLKAWAASRKLEVFSVIWNYASVVFFSLTLSLPAFLITKHFSSEIVAVGVAGVLALLPLFVGLLLWLQTWGSYVERRVNEIEAKIDGRSPRYYQAHDDSDFSRHAIHDRLERIEKIVDHLAVAVTGDAYLKMRARL